MIENMDAEEKKRLVDQVRTAFNKIMTVFTQEIKGSFDTLYPEKKSQIEGNIAEFFILGIMYNVVFNICEKLEESGANKKQIANFMKNLIKNILDIAINKELPVAEEISIETPGMEESDSIH